MGWTGVPAPGAGCPTRDQAQALGRAAPVLLQMRALVTWAPVPHPAPWRATQEVPLLCGSLEGAGLACQPRGRWDGSGSPVGQVTARVPDGTLGRQTDREAGSG